MNLLFDYICGKRTFGTLVNFKLDIVDPATSRVVKEFQQPVRFALDLRKHGIDLIELGGGFFLAYEDEENPGSFIDIPIPLLQLGGRLAAGILVAGVDPAGRIRIYRRGNLQLPGGGAAGTGRPAAIGRACLQQRRPEWSGPKSFPRDNCRRLVTFGHQYYAHESRVPRSWAGLRR